MQFTTASGAHYTVHNDLIAREQGRTPIFGLAFDGSDPTVCAREFEWLAPPAVGERATYRILATGELITTSTVESIEAD